MSEKISIDLDPDQIDQLLSGHLIEVSTGVHAQRLPPPLMGWVDTSKRVSPIGVRVIVWVDGLWLEACRMSTGQWFAPVIGQIHPTHWCEIVPPEVQI